jgi:hypothetical protein
VVSGNGTEGNGERERCVGNAAKVHDSPLCRDCATASRSGSERIFARI